MLSESLQTYPSIIYYIFDFNAHFEIQRFLSNYSSDITETGLYSSNIFNELILSSFLFSLH